MGQFAAKQSTNGDSKKSEALDPIVDRCYEKLKKAKDSDLPSIFYHEICGAVKEMNENLGGSMLLSLPDFNKVRTTFDDHIKPNSGRIRKEDIRDVIREVFSPKAFGVRGLVQMVGYIIGIPAVGVFLKNGLAPDIVSDEVFIPAATSASVVALTLMKKI